MGLRVVSFADLALRVCAGRVEIAQERGSQAVSTACIAHDLFHHVLRVPVRIDRLPRPFFVDGSARIRNTVHGASAGNHQLVDLRVAHGREQAERSSHVVAVILEWIGNGFTHIAVSREVHDRRGAVPAQHREQAVAVEQVAPFERTPTDGLFMAIHQVVVADRKVARGRKRLASVAANVSRAPRNKDGSFGQSNLALGRLRPPSPPEKVICSRRSPSINARA